MPTFNWKVTELRVDDGLVCQVKYHCEACEDNKKVATEGYLHAIPSNIPPKIGVNWEASKQILYYLKSIDHRHIEELVGDDCYSLNPKSDGLFNPLPDDGWKKDKEDNIIEEPVKRMTTEWMRYVMPYSTTTMRRSSSLNLEIHGNSIQVNKPLQTR